uniref:Uncharacterized protein n=1 Tax=Anopheles dirus TaxID=7168 RepID=A0A182N253_9DIPT
MSPTPSSTQIIDTASQFVLDLRDTPTDPLPQDKLCKRSERNQSKVSMGPVSIVAQFESESFTLKKCKFRPPTPVTSVTSLVECALRQSNEERTSISALEVTTAMALDVVQRIKDDSYPLFHIMHSQRRYLEGNLLKYRMILQPYVDQRVLAALDLNSLTVNGCDNEMYYALKREEILDRTACGLLSFPVNSAQYANALFDSVRYLSGQAIRTIQHKLNEP